MSLDPSDDLNVERNRVMLVGRALIRTRGQQKLAAALLGISPRVLSYLLTCHELRPFVQLGKDAARDEAAAIDRLTQFVASYIAVVVPGPLRAESRRRAA